MSGKLKVGSGYFNEAVTLGGEIPIKLGALFLHVNM